MEALLNTIWLLVAIGAVLFWRAEAAEDTTARREHSGWSHWLALTCALILLFPVISLTDDLHSEQAVMEESSRSALKARQAVESCTNGGKYSALLAAITPERSPDPCFQPFGRVTLPCMNLPEFLFARPSVARAPPFR